MRIRSGDSVIVIAGDDASESPRKVLQVLRGGRKLVVEGVNRVYKHVRRGHPKSPQGGRLELELPIDASNCLLYCPSCNRGVRIGYRYDPEGRKERYCKRCGSRIGEPGPPKRRHAQKTERGDAPSNTD
ncbi:MAG TPA: 50S ribosomal protein L24 [Planctomycetaceae bacterium]|nr:50S ribosomal protein L24 [Planctomycetaceae bacterium]